MVLKGAIMVAMVAAAPLPLLRRRGRLLDVLRAEAKEKRDSLISGNQGPVASVGVFGASEREAVAMERHYRDVTRMIRESTHEPLSPGQQACVEGEVIVRRPKAYVMNFVPCLSIDSQSTMDWGSRKEQKSTEEEAAAGDGADEDQQTVQTKAAKATISCSRQHPAVLKKHYASECLEKGLHPNSGVSSYVLGCDPCLCGLEVVSFRNLFVGDRGVVALLPLLRYSRNLRSLNLAGNGLRRDGIQTIVGALQEPGEHTTSLCILELSQNPMHRLCFDGLMGLAAARQNILMMGCTGTSLPPWARSRLLKRHMENLMAADPAEQERAFRLADEGGDYFADRELVHNVNSYLEEVRQEKQLATASILSPGGRRSGSPGPFSPTPGKKLTLADGAESPEPPADDFPMVRSGQRSGTPLPR